MPTGLLPTAGTLAANAIRREEEKVSEHRYVLEQVHQVLDEMVYDIETCEYECEIARLRHELHVAKNAVNEYQQRESVLIQERQQAFEYAVAVEQEGRAIVQRLEQHLVILVDEIAKKDSLDKELALAREQLQLSAQLSKELASAQREIRELHRRNSIQNLLKTTSAPGRVTTGANASFKLDRAVSSPKRANTPRVSQQQTPTSNQQETVEMSNPLQLCSDAVLMNVFSHLDANSVFVVSLTNRILMTRVHALFGMTPNSVVSKREKNTVAHTQHQPPPSALRQGVMKTRSQSNVNSSERGRSQLAKAEQIVKALKMDEIKLFHDMSTRVKSLETLLSQTQAEKEDIAARLHSAESVRDFLMDKLKDLEDRLTSMMEASSKKEEQNAMDREIIGFLDARIHEYEIIVKRFTAQSEELQRELAQARQEHASKITIVQDMVSLLTDEKRDLDMQLKSQRKVLVREVKALRAQNQQLSHEKDRYFKQLKQLRQALQHLDDLE